MQAQGVYNSTLTIAYVGKSTNHFVLQEGNKNYQRASQKLPADAVSLSPNPTRNKSFAIKLNNLTGESYITIYNIIGVLVKKFKMNSDYTRVNLSEFSKGIYLVNIANNKKKLVKKIVVQ